MSIGLNPNTQERHDRALCRVHRLEKYLLEKGINREEMRKALVYIAAKKLSAKAWREVSHEVIQTLSGYVKV